jgi:hypothetical protein
MGAKNHAVIMPDANLDAAVSALTGAAFGAAGQRCMAISAAVFVGGMERYREALVEKARGLKVGSVGRGCTGTGQALATWWRRWPGYSRYRPAVLASCRACCAHQGRPPAPSQQVVCLPGAGEGGVGGGRRPGPRHLPRGQAAYRAADCQRHRAGAAALCVWGGRVGGVQMGVGLSHR